MKFCLCSTTWMSHYNTYLRTVWSTNIHFGQNLFISLRKLANPSPKLQITHGKMYFYQGLPNWILRWVRVAVETIIFNCLGFQRAYFHLDDWNTGSFCINYFKKFCKPLILSFLSFIMESKSFRYKIYLEHVNLYMSSTKLSSDAESLHSHQGNEGDMFKYWNRDSFWGDFAVQVSSSVQLFGLASWHYQASIVNTSII